MGLSSRRGLHIVVETGRRGALVPARLRCCCWASASARGDHRRRAVEGDRHSQTQIVDGG